MLARSYQEGGHLKDAIDIYEKLNKTFTSRRLFWSSLDIKKNYYLGLAYEASNWNDQIIVQ